MGQSTRQSLYHAVLILIISIENHILCESPSEEDCTELLEPVFNVLPYVKNDSPNNKLMNTMLTVAAAKGVLPEVYSATRPMWPQRPLKPTQIQDVRISSKPQQPQFNPFTSQITSILQSRSPVVFPETITFDQHQNLTTTQESNPALKSNGIDHRLILVDPSQNNFECDNPIMSQDNDNNHLSVPFNGPSNMFTPFEYLNTIPTLGISTVFPGSTPSAPVTQNPINMATPENNVMPSFIPAPIPFAPITYPPFIASPASVLPVNGVVPDVVLINPSEGTCQCNEPQVFTLNDITNINPDISSPDNPVVQSNQVQHVPYNLEINLPVVTRIIPASDSGFSLPEYSPQFFSGPTLPPIINYSPFPFTPLPMPFLPPIVIQRPKSKSEDFLKIILLSQLLPFGFASGKNCGCGGTH